MRTDCQLASSLRVKILGEIRAHPFRQEKTAPEQKRKDQDTTGAWRGGGGYATINPSNCSWPTSALKSARTMDAVASRSPRICNHLSFCSCFAFLLPAALSFCIAFSAVKPFANVTLNPPRQLFRSVSSFDAYHRRFHGVGWDGMGSGTTPGSNFRSRGSHMLHDHPLQIS